MIFKLHFRYQVILIFLIVGLFISSSMGGLFYYLTISMEENLIEEILSVRLNHYIEYYATDTSISIPSKAQIHVVIENTLKENQYFIFFIFGMSLMVVLLGIIGGWLAGHVIAPIKKLTQLVSKMEPGCKTKSLLVFPKKFSYNEIEGLIRSINGYYQRSVAFNKRERAFSSDISHELRTSIAIIQGACEVMLTHSGVTDNNRKRLERIIRASTQITRLSTALLALAREESDPNQQQCSVEQVLTQAVNEHKYLLLDKSVEVILHTDSDFLVSANPSLLYIVFANLIRNAFSYTHQGKIDISQQNHSIIIKDTGRGIKKEQLIKIFDRHHYSTDHKNAGYGIGLSLVWRICQRYGWKISVDSHKRSGTCVKLQL